MNAWNPSANDVFVRSLELDPGPQRDAFIHESCGDDQEMLNQVQRLLSSHNDAGSFLNGPAVGGPCVLIDPVTDASASSNGFSGKESTDNEQATVFAALGDQLPGLTRIVLRDQQQGSEQPPLSTASETSDPPTAGRYRIEGEIARGGMGAVLKGKDTDLGRDIAIKVLLKSHRDTPEISLRFIEEAQIGGQLQHPGIAPIYELGQFEDGRPFFSMKLVKGNTLAGVLESRKDLGDQRARLLGIFEQICQTMSYAHSRGVIHRDLKPANVMVGAFGEVQLMDWGLAKVLNVDNVDDRAVMAPRDDADVVRTRRCDDSVDPDLVDSHTEFGSVLGTPAYMPPEQARGEIDQLDERADVFGLGAILCVILTGDPPYIGETGKDVFLASSRGEIGPCFDRLSASESDPELQRLARDCLAISTSDRLRDASAVAKRISDYVASVEMRLRDSEVQTAAEKARADEAIKTAVSERKRRRSTLALAASILVSLSIGGYALNWFARREQTRMLANTHLLRESLGNISRLRDKAENASSDSKIQEWTAVLAEAEKAKALLSKGQVDPEVALQTENTVMEVEDVAERVASEVRREAEESAFIDLLDEIRLARSEGEFAHELDLRVIDERYEEAFQSKTAVGLDILGDSPEETAERIRNSPFREHMIVALDVWVRSTPGHVSRQKKLLTVASLVDDNRWRGELRIAAASFDGAALRRLALRDDTQQQPVAMLVNLGIALRSSGETDASIQFLRGVQLQYPNDFWVNFELARTLSGAGSNSEAIEFARAAVAARPSSGAAVWDLAQFLQFSGRLEESSQVYDRLCLLVPDDFFVRTHYAELLMSLGRTEDAMLQSREAVRINRTNSWGHRGLGAAYEQLGRRGEAIAAYQTAIDVMPGDTTAYRKLNRLLETSGEKSQADEVIEKLLAVGAKYESDQRWNAAIHVYTQAVETNPNYARAQFALGAALEHQGELEMAAEALRRATKTDPQFSRAFEKLQDVRKMQAIRSQLNAVLTGESRFTDDQRMAAARLCYIKKQYSDSTALYRELITQQKDLPDELSVVCRILGACSAVLTSKWSEENESVRFEHRQRAHKWLQEVLTLLNSRRQSGETESYRISVETLYRLRTSTDLGAIRDAGEVEQLPMPEREKLATLWQRVDDDWMESRLQYFQAMLERQPNNELIAGQFAEVLLDRQAPDWTYLKPAKMISDAGAVFELLPDNSILVSGPNENGDVYHVECEIQADAIAGVRLEALPHSSLPLNGPGRGFNHKHETGNFVLENFSVRARPADMSKSSESLHFAEAWSDLAHPEYPIDESGYWNLGAWERGKGQGKPHEALFQLRPAVVLETPTQLTFEIRFQANPPFYTNLGRFRLSLTEDPLHIDQKYANGFAKLAAAYEAADDKAALAGLMDRTRAAARAVGDSHVRNSRWKEAVACYDLLGEDERREPDLLKQRAVALANLGRNDQAAADWHQLLQQIPSDRGATSDRSLLLERLLREFPRVFERLVALRPDDTHLKITVARQHALMRDWKAAVQAYSGVIKDCPIGEEWFEYACALLLANEHSKYHLVVAEFFERAKNNKDPFIAYSVARAAAVGASSSIQSTDLVALANQAALVERRPWYLHVLSLAHFREGDHEAAYRVNRQSVEAPWHNGAAQIELVAAMTSHRQGKPELAEQHLSATIKRIQEIEAQSTDFITLVPAPDWMELMILRREAETMLGPLTESTIRQELDRLNEAIEESPESTTARYNRGYYLNRLGRWQESVSDFAIARDLDPTDRSPWMWTATTLVLSGDESEYRRLCSEMVAELGASDRADVADTVCKVALLLPDTIELSELPIRLLRDATTVPKWQVFRPYFAACCALISYREGDPNQAIVWSQRAGTSGPPGAMGLLVRAMAEYQLDARRSATENLMRAESLIPFELRSLGTDRCDRLLPVANDSVGFDWLIAEILRREARSLVDDPN